MSGLTALLSAYAATLALRRKAPYRRLTTAFAIMGLLFVPYQFLLPVFHGALRLVTAHTVWGLSMLGFAPTVEVGVTGQPTALRFPAARYLRYNIISACTGISATTLFAGLIGAADAPLKRRVGVALATFGFVYCMNILRTVIVGGAIGGPWFAATAPLTTVLFGVERPVLVSFYFAEYLLVQLLVVLVLLGVYAAVVRQLPSVQRLADDDPTTNVASYLPSTFPSVRATVPASKSSASTVTVWTVVVASVTVTVTSEPGPTTPSPSPSESTGDAMAGGVPSAVTAPVVAVPRVPEASLACTVTCGGPSLRTGPAGNVAS